MKDCGIKLLCFFLAVFLTAAAALAEVDLLFLEQLEKTNQPLRWENIEAEPEWISGIKPKYDLWEQLHIIQLKPGKAVSEERVLSVVTGLSRYKQPRRVYFDAVPRNPTGKIEKPKLRLKYADHAINTSAPDPIPDDVLLE